MNTKSIIATTALLTAIINVAEQGSVITVEEAGAADINLVFVHPKYGTQKLLAVNITDNLYSVSFVGHQELLKKLDTDGWLASAETVSAFLLEAGVDFTEELSKIKQLPLGPNFSLLVLGEESVELAAAQAVLEALDADPSVSDVVDSIVQDAVTGAQDVIEEIPTLSAAVGAPLDAALENLAHDAATAATESVEHLLRRDDESETEYNTRLLRERAARSAHNAAEKVVRFFNHRATRVVAGALVVGGVIALGVAIRNRLSMAEEVIEL